MRPQGHRCQGTSEQQDGRMVAPDPRPLTQGLPVTGQLQLAPGHLDRLGVHSPHLLLKLTPERKLARDPLCHWAGPSRASGCAQASWGSLDHRPSKPRCPQNRCHVTAGAQERLEHYGLNCCGQPWAGVPREGTPLPVHSYCPQKKRGNLSILPHWNPSRDPYPPPKAVQHPSAALGGQGRTEEGQERSEAHSSGE